MKIAQLAAAVDVVRKHAPNAKVLLTNQGLLIQDPKIAGIRREEKASVEEFGFFFQGASCILGRIAERGKSVVG